jgi:hypothetical protein
MGGGHITLESLLRLFELIAIVGGGGILLFKLGRAVSRFEIVGEAQAREITQLKDTVKSVADLITKYALQTQRLDNCMDRLEHCERLIDDLRRGEGFILPISKGVHER